MRRLVLVSLVVLAVASAAGATLVHLASERAHAITEARQSATEEAGVRVARVLSYEAENIEGDIQRAQQDTAGAFAEYYPQFAQRMIAPAVRQQGTSSVAAVKRSAVVNATPERVELVVFIDQRTSHPQQEGPQQSSTAATVTMTKVGGQWLISELRPATEVPGAEGGAGAGESAG